MINKSTKTYNELVCDVHSEICRKLDRLKYQHFYMKIFTNIGEGAINLITKTILFPACIGQTKSSKENAIKI